MAQICPDHAIAEEKSALDTNTTAYYKRNSEVIRYPCGLLTLGAIKNLPFMHVTLAGERCGRYVT